MGKKTKKTRKQAPIEVEDHGNGFMIIGTNLILEAKAALEDYVDDVGVYRFACPTFYKERGSVWLTTEPGQVWEGATDGAGNLVRDSTGPVHQ